MSEHTDQDDHIRDQLEAYALGALEPGEAAQVREHLLTCADCRSRLAALEEIAGTLPDALAAIGPHAPDDLKARLMEMLADASAATDQEQPSPVPPPAPTTETLAGVPGPTVTPLVRWRPRVSPTAIARLAAVAVLLLSLVWSVRLAVALERERAIRAEFAALVSQQEVVLEVVDSDKTVRRVLLTTEPGGCDPGTCPYGKLFTRSDLRHVVAMAARLPGPPAGEVYRLWVTATGRAEPAGTLTLDDKGFGLLVFDANLAGPTYEMAEVILQPGESRAPAGNVVLRWTPSAPS